MVLEKTPVKLLVAVTDTDIDLDVSIFGFTPGSSHISSFSKRITVRYSCSR